MFFDFRPRAPTKGDEPLEVSAKNNDKRAEAYHRSHSALESNHKTDLIY